MEIVNKPDPFYFSEEGGIPPENSIAFICGKCYGILLYTRGDDDKHMMFEIWGEDDGYYFKSNISSSAYWIPSLIEDLKLAQEWMNKNCKKIEWGYEKIT